MKSSAEKLIERGYLKEIDLSNYKDKTDEERVSLLKSKIAIERTLGARLFIDSQSVEVVNVLLNALRKEQKLYSKLAICTTLAAFKKVGLVQLIGALGTIGKNQHKAIPMKPFKKNNYPLPRDIIARTIIRIEANILPDLISDLTKLKTVQLSELIDAIGFITFYNYNSSVYEPLKNCYVNHSNNPLIQWKIIRAMSGLKESTMFLKEELNSINHPLLKREINRSLTWILKS